MGTPPEASPAKTWRRPHAETFKSVKSSPYFLYATLLYFGTRPRIAENRKTQRLIHDLGRKVGAARFLLSHRAWSASEVGFGTTPSQGYGSQHEVL
jgi:hypothetical protein